MKREHFLAAELFGYSYDHYADHLGMNDRFDYLMPNWARSLETAVREQWDEQQVARELDVSVSTASDLLQHARDVLPIVDAPDAAAAFRAGVRRSIYDALENGLDDEDAVEQLVVQICYRAADLGHMLADEGRRLSQYSEQLRWEPEDEDEM